MIDVKIKTEGAERLLKRVQEAVSPKNQDDILKRVAWETLPIMVQETPKATGELRKRWEVRHLRQGMWTVVNPSRIMAFLEYGTGHKTGGWIYPKKARALFVALSKKARELQEGLVYGVDFVLAKRVRGIKAGGMVARERKKTQGRVKVAFEKAIRDAIHGTV